jgi:hypothetical protein
MTNKPRKFCKELYIIDNECNMSIVDTLITEEINHIINISKEPIGEGFIKSFMTAAFNEEDSFIFNNKLTISSQFTHLKNKKYICEHDKS